MLHFFSKKSFVLDAIEAMPDIHCHVLPGIDDGAKDIATARELLLKYKDLGFKKIIATPHTLAEIYPNTKDTIAQAYQKIAPLLPEIELSYASEYMLDYDFEKRLESEDLLCLKGSYLLVEFSYFQPPMNFEELLFRITSKGYIPVLAHPERYTYFHKKVDIFKKLKNNGCHLQLNALSLSTHYGTQVQKIAHKLLLGGMYDFLGTDTHRMDHLEKLAEMKVSKKLVAPLSNLSLNNKRVFG